MRFHNSGKPPPTRAGCRRAQTGSVVAALLALPLVAAIAAFVIASGARDLAAPAGAGPDGLRIAELTIAARAWQRFGLAYPTIAVGWRRPTLGRPVLSRPPGTDLAVRAAFAAGGASPASARAFALGATAAAVLALGRLAWIGWGPGAAVAGAALFALLPLNGAYAPFPNGEMPALAAALMALGSMLLFRRGRARLAAVSAVAWMLVAGLFDWSAYLLVPLVWAIAVAASAAQRWQRQRAGKGIGAIARLRPQMLGLPDGLSGPLANILMRREGETALALTAALATAALGELCFFLVWDLKLGALSAFFASFAGGGGQAPVASVPLPGPLSPSLVGAAGAAVVVAWLAATAARLALGQGQARSVPVAALLGAGGLFALLFPTLARSSAHLPALAAGGLVLAAVDVAAVLGALVAARRLVAPDAPPLAAGVALGVMAALALATLPGWQRARAENPARGGRARAATAIAPDGDGDGQAGARAFARLVGDRTEVGDQLLVLRGFPLPLDFLYQVDREIEIVPTLEGLEARRDREPRSVALLQEPLDDQERGPLEALVQQHPAIRIAPRWFIDLRRYEAGIQSFVPAAGGLEARPWEALKLDLANHVSPSLDYLPEIGGELALARGELFAYYNLHNARGPNAERERARAKLLEGFATRPRWLDPAPLGLPAGVRWSSHEGRLDLVWECAGTAPKPPPGAGVGAARFVLSPADRNWRPVAFDRPITPACPPGARAGELYEQSFALRIPFRGRWRVALQLLRDGKPRRPLNPAPVELGAIENGARD